MSVAPLIQLMSRGKQNDILSGDSPQITFWRYRHMRYTDFALEHVNVTNGQGEQAVALGPMKFDLPRSGDLVNDCFAVFRLPGLANVFTPDANTVGKPHLNRASYWDVDNRCVRTATTGTAQSAGTTRHELIESAEERERYAQAGTNTLTLPGPQPYWCNGVGQAILDKVQLKVGSQYVDHLYSDYLFMWDELSDKPGRSVNTEGYGRMCMKGTAAQRKCWSQTSSTVYVPIPMFFMRTSGNALPLIALQFHGVCIELNCLDPTNFIINSKKHADRDGLSTALFVGNNGMHATFAAADIAGSWETVRRGSGVVAGGVGSADDIDAATGSYLLCTTANHDSKFATPIARAHCHVSLNVGYVYLNVAERNKFADASFEILIDQVQENIQTDIDSASFAGQSLTLNHMVQELVWACKRTGENTIRYEPFDYRGDSDFVNGVARDPIKSVQLRLNNSTRFNMNNGSDVDAQYFRTVEPYLHHTRVPDNHIYAYSFALNPESEQPSGAINMSRIDSAKLTLRMASTTDVAGSGYKKRDSLAREQQGGAAIKTQTESRLQLKLFARNWNVFRVTLGLGGVKWAS